MSVGEHSTKSDAMAKASLVRVALRAATRAGASAQAQAVFATMIAESYLEVVKGGSKRWVAKLGYPMLAMRLNTSPGSVRRWADELKHLGLVIQHSGAGRRVSRWMIVPQTEEDGERPHPRGSGPRVRTSGHPDASSRSLRVFAGAHPQSPNAGARVPTGEHPECAPVSTGVPTGEHPGCAPVSTVFSKPPISTYTARRREAEAGPPAAGSESRKTPERMPPTEAELAEQAGFLEALEQKRASAPPREAAG